MSKVGLSAPWVEFYKKVNAMFAKDPEVKVVFDEDENVISLYVDNPLKADALTEILPTERVFGEIAVQIRVIPSNTDTLSTIQLFRTAFEGNEAFSYTFVPEGPLTIPMNYVVFKNEVVQYFNDNLGDVHGLQSTLYQEIAKDIFKDQHNIYFCTDLPQE